MKIFQTLVTISFLFAFTADLSADELWGGNFVKLKSRIIRSVAIAPYDQATIIVGNKGSAAGEAKLFASSNGGISWQFLNGGKSLAPSGTDVQSVAIVSPIIMLAGTWKHGLYRSADAGESFSPVRSLPAKDIRSILMLNGGRILAATGRDGIWMSDDAGINWIATNQATGYFWSLQSGSDAAGKSVVYATSPNNGLYRSTDGGNNWEQIHNIEGLYEATSIGAFIAAVGENGMVVSADNGDTWSSVKSLGKVRLASIVADQDDAGSLLIGSWSDGLWRYNTTDRTLSRFAEKLPVLHVRATDHGVVLGTWGKGLHILPRSATTDYLVDAARAADTSVIDDLLKAGANPDSFDKNNNTALTYAGRDGLLNIAELLIGKGADVNWIDGEGVTPLILAVFKNHIEVVRLLLAHNADKTVVDDFGRTAIDYALRRGDSDPVAQLLK